MTTAKQNPPPTALFRHSHIYMLPCQRPGGTEAYMSPGTATLRSTAPTKFAAAKVGADPETERS